MPEGDTLHRIANALRPALVGQRVVAFELPRQAGVGRSVPGHVVTSVSAYGKNLHIAFDHDVVLHTHLKMHGSWHLLRRGAPWPRARSHLVARIELATHEAMCFDAPVVRLVDASRLAREHAAQVLGPDLLAPDAVASSSVPASSSGPRIAAFDLDEAVRRLAARASLPIGEAVVDQRVFQGVGNIYKSEGLFRARMNPFARVDSYHDDELRRLVLDLRFILQRNVARAARGGSALAYERTTTDDSAGGSGPLFVYQRQHAPCLQCGCPIAMKRQGATQRSTYYCPRCQNVDVTTS